MSFITTNLRVQYQYHDSTSNTDIWNTITDYLTAFKISRPHKTAGSLSVSLINDLLDPSTHPNNDLHIRKGQKARVQVLVGGVWKNIFAGTIKRQDTTFNSTATSVAGQRTVHFTAHDSIHEKKQKLQSNGVGAVDDLRAFVDTPFNIDGQTATKSATGVNTFQHDNTSEWDQILITRDTQQGFAWVDKDDTLQVWSRANKTTANKADIVPADYSSVNLNYTIENIINEVVVKEIQKYKNGKTHVVHKGFWYDGPSRTKYGSFRATYTVQDHLATWADDHAFAQNILDNNADPVVVPTGCVIPIITTGDVSAFLDAIDLTDKITINVDGTIYSCRVDTISVESDGVILAVGFTFTHQNIVYKPHVKPGTGISNVTDGQVETEHLDDQAVTTEKIGDLAVTIDKLADGAVDLSKISFSIHDIGGTVSSVQSTPPSSPTIGDLWIDTGNGNILKRWNGTSWASLQDLAIATAQNTANSALTTANGKNRVTYSTSSPGTTANTAGDIWFRISGTTVIEQWQGNGGTSWTQVTLTNSVISSLDAGKITTGTLDAARIGANSITTTKLAVTIGGGNLQTNSSFEDTTGAGGGNVGSSTNWTRSTTRAWTGANSINVTTTGATGNIGYQHEYFSVGVADGIQFTLSAYIYRGAGTGNIRFAIQWLDASFASVGSAAFIDVPNTTTGVWQRWSVTGTAPTNTRNIRVQVYYTSYVAGTDTFYLDAIQVERGDLLTAYAPKVDEILPGTIIASMIAANTITASQLAANSVTATQIAAGSIDGMTITGPVIQTASGVGSGVQGLKIEADLIGGVIKFYYGVSGETPGYINPNTLGPSPIIDINSGATPAKSFGAQLTLGTGSTASGSTGPLVAVQKGALALNDTTQSQAVITYQYAAAMAFDLGKFVFYSNQGSPAAWQSGFTALPSSANTAVLHGAAIHSWIGGFWMEDLSGGGNTGANINTSGRIVRTSTVKMKEKIRDMTDAEAFSVLGLKSYTFEFKKDPEYPDLPKDPRRYPGFIAEQGAEVGAELWVGRQHKVDRDQKTGKITITRDKNGEIIYFRTGEVTVAHNHIIKNHHSRIEELEAKLQQVEEELAALTR